MRRCGAVLAGLALALTGCEQLAPHPQVSNSDKCANLAKQQDVKNDEGRTVLLVDTSNSVRGSSSELGGPDYSLPLGLAVKEAVDGGHRVVVSSFSGKVAGLDPIGVRTRPVSNNDTNRSHETRVAQECLEQAVRSATMAPPLGPGSDVLGSIREAADWVRQGSGAKKIVLATDGLPTTGCADLTKAVFGGATELSEIVKVCQRRKELRDGDLTDVQLQMIGVGRTAPEQPVATAEQLDWLRELWKGICQAASARTCDISLAMPTGKETLPRAVESMPDPVVGFTKVFRIVLPEKTLFDTGKSDLRAGARAALTLIAVNLRTLSASKVEVAGHADSRGTTDSNQELSENRAEEVVKFLAAQHVGKLHAVGFGETRPVCRSSMEDSCLQQNRRVEITVYQL